MTRERSAETGPRVVGEVYARLGNGGAAFRVEDSGRGPEVVVEAGHFGNSRLRYSVAVTAGVLEELARLFARAAAAKYSAEYAHAAGRRGDAP